MCRATLYQLCFMSTSIAVFGCDGEILISFVMIFFMSTLIAIKGWLDQLYINLVSYELPLHALTMLLEFMSTLCYVNFHCSFWMHWWNIYQFCFMSTSIARFAHVTWIHIHFVLCQLPLQFLDALMKFISILFHVTFHCNYKVP